MGDVSSEDLLQRDHSVIAVVPQHKEMVDMQNHNVFLDGSSKDWLLVFPVEKVVDSFVHKDETRYYQVKFHDFWVDETSLVLKYKHLVDAFWKSLQHDLEKPDGDISEVEVSQSDITNVSEPDIQKTKVIVEKVSQIVNEESLRVQEEKKSSSDGEKSVLTKVPASYNDPTCEQTPFINLLEPGESQKQSNENKCNICAKTLSSKKVLKRHMTLKHFKNGRHQCTMCSKRFISSHELWRHMPVHTNIKLYQCKVCLKSFKQAGQLYKHMKIHTGEKKFECEHCNRKFSQKNNLETHYYTHNEEKLFQCSECQTKFKHKNSVYLHIKRHHTDSKNVNCVVKEPGEILHGSYLNRDIGKKPTEEDLNKNYLGDYLINKSREKVQEDVLFKCEKCIQSFLTLKSLSHHMLLIHEIDGDNPMLSNQENDGDNISSKQKTYRNNHILSIKGNNADNHILSLHENNRNNHIKYENTKDNQAEILSTQKVSESRSCTDSSPLPTPKTPNVCVTNIVNNEISCSKCPKMFLSKDMYYVHFQMQHEMRDSVIVDLKTKNDKVRDSKQEKGDKKQEREYTHIQNCTSSIVPAKLNDYIQNNTSSNIQAKLNEATQNIFPDRSLEEMDKLTSSKYDVDNIFKIDRDKPLKDIGKNKRKFMDEYNYNDGLFCHVCQQVFRTWEDLRIHEQNRCTLIEKVTENDTRSDGSFKDKTLAVEKDVSRIQVIDKHDDKSDIKNQVHNRHEEKNSKRNLDDKDQVTLISRQSNIGILTQKEQKPLTLKKHYRQSFRENVILLDSFECDTCKTSYPDRITLIHHLMSQHKSEIIKLRDDSSTENSVISIFGS